MRKKIIEYLTQKWFLVPLVLLTFGLNISIEESLADDLITSESSESVVKISSDESNQLIEKDKFILDRESELEKEGFKNLEKDSKMILPLSGVNKDFEIAVSFNKQKDEQSIDEDFAHNFQISILEGETQQEVYSPFSKTEDETGLFLLDENGSKNYLYYQSDTIKFMKKDNENQVTELKIIGLDEENRYLLESTFELNSENNKISITHQVRNLQEDKQDVTLNYSRNFTNELGEEKQEIQAIENDAEDSISWEANVSEYLLKTTIAVDRENLEQKLFAKNDDEAIDLEGEQSKYANIVVQSEARKLDNLDTIGVSFDLSLDIEENELNGESLTPQSINMDYGTWDPKNPGLSLPFGYTESATIEGVKLLNPSSKLEQYFIFNGLSARQTSQSNSVSAQPYSLKDFRAAKKVSWRTSGNIGLNTIDIKSSPIAKMSLPRVVTFPSNNDREFSTSYSFPSDPTNVLPNGDGTSYDGAGIVLIAHDANNKVQYYPKDNLTSNNTTQLTHYFTNKDNTAVIAFGYYDLTNGVTNLRVPMRVTFDNVNGRGRAQIGYSFMKPSGMSNSLSLKMGYTIHMDIAGKHESSQMRSLGYNEGIYFDEKIKNRNNQELNYYVAFYGQPRGKKLQGIEGFRVYDLYDGGNSSKPAANVWRKSYPTNWRTLNGDWGSDMYPEKEINDKKRGEVYTDYDYKNNRYSTTKLTHPAWFFYYPSKQVKVNEVVNYGMDMDVTDVKSLGFPPVAFQNNQTKTSNPISETKFNVSYIQPVEELKMTDQYKIDYLEIKMTMDKLVKWKNSDFTIKNGSTSLTSGVDYTVSKVNENVVSVKILNSYLTKIKSTGELKINQISDIDFGSLTKSNVSNYYNSGTNSFNVPVAFENSWYLIDGTYKAIEEGISKKDQAKIQYVPTINYKLNDVTIVPTDATSDKNKSSYFAPSNYFVEQPKNGDFEWDTLSYEYDTPLPDYKNNLSGDAKIKVSSSNFNVSPVLTGKYEVLPTLNYPPVEIVNIGRVSGATRVPNIKLNATYKQELPEMKMTNNNNIKKMSIDINVDPNMIKPKESDFVVKYNNSVISDYQLNISGSVYSFIFDNVFLSGKKGAITIEQSSNFAELDENGNIIYTSNVVNNSFVNNSDYYGNGAFVDGSDTKFWALKFPVKANNQWTWSNGTIDKEIKSNEAVSDFSAVRPYVNFSVVPKTATNIPPLEGQELPSIIKVKPGSIATNEIAKATSGTTNYVGPDHFLDVVKGIYSKNDGNIKIETQRVGKLTKFDEVQNLDFKWDAVTGDGIKLEYYVKKVVNGKEVIEPGLPDFSKEPKGNVYIRVESTNFKIYSQYTIPYEVVTDVNMTVNHVDESGKLLKKIDMANLPGSSTDLEEVSVTEKTIKSGTSINLALSDIENVYTGYTYSNQKPIIKTISGQIITNDVVPDEDFTVTYKYQGKILVDVTENISFGKNTLSIFNQSDREATTQDVKKVVSMINTSDSKSNWRLSVQETRAMTYGGELEGEKLRGEIYFYDKESKTSQSLDNPYTVGKNIFDSGDTILQNSPLIPSKSANQIKESGVYLKIHPGNKSGTYSNGELTWILTDAP